MLRQFFQCSLSRSAKIRIKDEIQKRKQAFEKAIKDLGDSFAISTLKATEGRAQRRVFDKDIVQTIVNMALKVADKSKNDMFFDFADDEDVKVAASILAPAIFVVAGGHVSSAKYELQEMGCLRFVLAGSRTIVLLDALAIKQHVDMGTPEGGSEFTAAENWANNASQAALQEFVAKGGKVYTATTGPMDVLYVPAGWLCFHKVQQAADHVGLRIGTATKNCIPVLSEIRLDQRSCRKDTSVKDALLAFMNKKFNGMFLCCCLSLLLLLIEFNGRSTEFLFFKQEVQRSIDAK